MQAKLHKSTPPRVLSVLCRCGCFACLAGLHVTDQAAIERIPVGYAQYPVALLGFAYRLVANAYQGYRPVFRFSVLHVRWVE